MTPRDRKNENPDPRDDENQEFDEGDWEEDEDFVGEDGDDWEEEEWEEILEEAPAASKAPLVNFDGSRAAQSTQESRSRLFASRRRKVKEDRERQKRLRHLKIVGASFLGLLVLGLIAFMAIRIVERSRVAAEKAGGELTAGLLAGGEGSSAEAGQSILDGGGALEHGGLGTAEVVEGESDLSTNLRRVQALIAEKKFKDAQRLMAVLEQRYPRSAKVAIVKGWTVLQSAPASAAGYARKALLLEPRNKEALDLLSLAFELARSQGLSRENEIAIREFEVKNYVALLDRSPEWSELIYRLSSQRIALYQLDPARVEELETSVGELEQVLLLLRGANARGNELASVHFQLGRALRHQADRRDREKKAEEARELRERAAGELALAIRGDANYVDAFGELMLVRERQGKGQEAVAELALLADEMDRKEAKGKAFEMLGALHQKAGRLEEARRYYEDALTHDERLLGSLVGLAGIYGKTGQPGLAREKLDDSVRNDEDFLEGYVRLGQVLMLQSKPTEAIEVFEKAMAVPRDRARTLDTTPSRNLARNRFYYLAASSLAWLYIEEANDVLKAGEAVERARRYGNPDRHLRDTIGWIYFRSGNFERAVETFEALIEDSGSFPEAQYHLAASYAELGRADEAFEALEKALSDDETFSHRAEAEALRRSLAASRDTPPD